MNGYQINKFMFFICDHCLSNFHISKGKGKVQLTASVVGSQSESHSQANQTLTTDIITVMLLMPQRAPSVVLKVFKSIFSRVWKCGLKKQNSGKS